MDLGWFRFSVSCSSLLSASALRFYFHQREGETEGSHFLLAPAAPHPPLGVFFFSRALLEPGSGFALLHGGRRSGGPPGHRSEKVIKPRNSKAPKPRRNSDKFTSSTRTDK